MTVLPADETAHPPQRSLDRAKALAVALTPHQPFVVGGNELPVVQREPAVRRVVQQGVVDRAGALRVDLVHTGDEPDAVLPGDGPEPLTVWPWDRDRLASEQCIRLLGARLVPARERIRPR